ncbi:MAG: glycogen/starch synthase [Candidatus Woesearchaeota archaeon]
MNAMRNKSRPKLLIATPELTVDLDVGMGNLPSIGVNFQQGGMAPVTSTDVVSMTKEGTFRVYATVPKWESSLKELNELVIRDIKIIDSKIPNNFFMISHPAFNKVKVEGSNTKMYEDSWRFSSMDRAIAFSSGIVNTILPKINPDIVWLNDWMLGPVAPVAKALGIKVVTTGHNIFTKVAPFDELIYKGIDLRDSEDYTPVRWVWKSDNKFDFMATAVNAADDFITVSEGFLERILKGDIDYLAPSVTNAIKNKSYNTHSDGRLRVHGYLNPLETDKSKLLESIELYGLGDHIAWRKNNSAEIRRIAGLKDGGYLLVFPNRLYGQKLPSLLIDNATYLANKYDLRILFLANGDPKIARDAGAVAVGSKGLVAYMPFNKKMEKLVKNSDNTYGLMTSEYEPCGGPNLNYPLEGILIGAHAIDGLKDTVKHLDVKKSVGNGFPYENNDSTGLEYCISEIVKFASLPDNIRYQQYTRIAKETLLQHASAPRAKRLVEEIFLPLYHEKHYKKK